ncbi:hypothetical protein ACM792_21885 [Metapseudomonas otitidis]|uniref:hypothetical protein n=1 Tax=Metapseudomonas otitidis TaxID=319939 RepID=UPI0039FD42BC
MQYIRHHDDARLFCASIVRVNEPQDDDGFVIITADASGSVVDMHDRRPAAFAPALV